MEGQEVIFTCYSDGGPPPTLNLRKEGEEPLVTDSTSSLSYSIPAASLRDSALYLCEASNQFGSQLVSKNVTVKGIFDFPPPKEKILSSDAVEITVCTLTPDL